MDYRTFVMNYKHIEQYRKDVEDIETELDVILHNLKGVRSVSYGGVHVNGNPSVMEEKRLEMIELYNYKIGQLEFVQHAVNEVEAILSRMPETLKKTLEDVYHNGKTFARMGMEHGYSDNGYWNYLRRETEKYL